MNDEKNIIINIKLSEDKIASRLQEIRKEIDKIENQNKSLQKSLNLVGDNFGVVGKSIENNNKLIKELEKEYNTLQSKLSDNTKATQDYNDSLNRTNKSFQDTSSSIKNLSDSIDKNSDSLDSNKRSLDDLASSQGDFDNNTRKSIDSSNDFSDTLEDLNDNIEDTTENLEKLGDVDIEYNVDTESLKDANTALNDLISSESKYGEATDLIRTRTNDLTGALIEETRQIQEIANDLRTVSDINVNVNTERSRDELVDLANTAVNTRDDIIEAVESIRDFDNVDLNIEGRVNINTNDAEQSLRNLERDVDRTKVKIDDFARNNKVDVEVDVKFDQSKVNNSIDELNKKLDTTKSKARETKAELQTIEQLDFRRVNVEDLNVPLDKLTDEAKQFGQTLLDVAINSDLLKTALNNLGIEADSALSNVVKNLESFLANWSKAGFSKAGAISAGLSAGFDIIANAIRKADQSTLDLDEHLKTIKFQSSRTFARDFADSLKEAMDDVYKEIADMINSIPQALDDVVSYALGGKSIEQTARENVEANVRARIEERKEAAEAELKSIQEAEETLKFKQQRWERELHDLRLSLNSDTLTDRIEAQKRINEIERKQAEELYELAERKRKLFEEALKKTIYKISEEAKKAAPTTTDTEGSEETPHRRGPRFDFGGVSRRMPRKYPTRSDRREIAKEEANYEITEEEVELTKEQQAALEDLTATVDKYRDAKEKANKTEQDFIASEPDIIRIAELEKDYNEARRKYEDEELERKYQIQKLESQEGDNSEAIYQIRKKGLEDVNALLRQRYTLESEQNRVAGARNEEETEQLHKTGLEIRKTELELEKLRREHEKTNSVVVEGLEEEDQGLKKIQEDQKQLAQAQRDYSREQERREQQIRELRRQEGDQSQQIYEIQKKGLEEYIEILQKRVDLEADTALLHQKENGEFSEDDLEKMNKAALELEKYQNILKNLDDERDIAIKKKEEESQLEQQRQEEQRKEEERLSKIAAKEKDYNDARRQYELDEITRREELTKLEQDSDANSEAIRQKRIEGLNQYLQVLDKQEKAVKEGIVDDKNKTEQEIQSLHRIEVARRQTQNEINRLQQETNKTSEEGTKILTEQEKQLAAAQQRQRKLNDENRKYALDQIQLQQELADLRRLDGDQSEAIYEKEKANLERRIELLRTQKDILVDIAAANSTKDENGNLIFSEEDLDRANRAEQDLQKAELALHNLNEERRIAVERQNAEAQAAAQLATQEQQEANRRQQLADGLRAYNDLRRQFENDEVDRRQRIQELRNEDADNEEAILQVRRDGLTARLDLLNKELEYTRSTFADINNLTEEEVEAQHRLELQIKETANEIANLSSQNGGVGGLSGMFDEASDSSKEFMGNIKNATDALATLGVQGGSAIRRLITGLQKVSKLLTSGPMIAIAGIIATITIFVKGISKAFDENEELVEKLHEAYASFEPILKAFETTCKILAEGIIDLVNAVGRLYRAFAGTEEMYQKQIKAAQELKKANEELDKAKTNLAYREEIRSYRAAELQRIIKDTELKSIDERIKAQKELNKIELQNLKDREKIAWDAVEIYQKEMDQAKEITKDMVKHMDELKVAALKASNALKIGMMENYDAMVAIYSEFTEKELQIKLDEIQRKEDMLNAEVAQIDELSKAVMHNFNLQQAILFLRKKGVSLTFEEKNDWEAIYDKLLQIKPILGQFDKEKSIINESIERVRARNKTNTTKTPKATEEKGPDYEKYWEDMFKKASKDLAAFHKELRDAEKDVEELGMTALEIFDRNLDETLKDIDARKGEIEATIMEILNTPATTDQERERQQQAFDYYVEYWNSLEDLKTQISLKAAKEREKLEEEAILDSYEKRAQQLERYYRRMEYNKTMNQNGTTDPTKAVSTLDPLSSSLLNLDQAKDELKLLMDTLKELDPASEAYQEFADKVVEANMKVIESQQQVIDEVVNTANSYIDSYGAIAGALASYYQAEKKSVQNSNKTAGEKEALIEQLEKKERMATLAQIAFSTASSIAQVVADAAKAGWPAMIPIILGGIATVISSIAAAKSAMSGYAEGGIIPGSSYSGDNVQARVNSGEMILTRKQQKQLFDIANGNGGNGFNYELMVNAFSAALTNMPSPTLDYQEFTTFSDNVNRYDSLVKIR